MACVGSNGNQAHGSWILLEPLVMRLCSHTLSSSSARRAFVSRIMLITVSHLASDTNLSGILMYSRG